MLYLQSKRRFKPCLQTWCKFYVHFIIFFLNLLLGSLFHYRMIKWTLLMPRMLLSSMIFQVSISIFYSACYRISMQTPFSLLCHFLLPIQAPKYLKSCTFLILSWLIEVRTVYCSLLRHINSVVTAFRCWLILAALLRTRCRKYLICLVSSATRAVLSVNQQNQTY